jgi:hypothetical protein
VLENPYIAEQVVTKMKVLNEELAKRVSKERTIIQREVFTSAF